MEAILTVLADYHHVTTAKAVVTAQAEHRWNSQRDNNRRTAFPQSLQSVAKLAGDARGMSSFPCLPGRGEGVMADELDTAVLRDFIATIGDALVQMEVGGDRNAIKKLIKQEIGDRGFARGFLLGASGVLKCGGVPKFISGEGARNLEMKLLVIAHEFKIAEFLEKNGASA